MLSKLILDGVSRTLNRLLSSDPLTQRSLAEMAGKTLQVSITTPAANFWIHLAETGIQLSDSPPESVSDVEITGSASALLKLLTSPERNFSNAGVKVRGDVGLLLQLSRISNQMEIDWETLLADQIGDMPASLIGRSARMAQTESAKLKLKTEEWSEQWVNERQKQFVTRSQFDALRPEVLAVQLACERLEARLRHLKSSTTK